MAEDEEEDGGPDLPEDYEYWADEGDGPWVHSLLEAEEDEDTESDQEDASCTDSLSRQLCSSRFGVSLHYNNTQRKHHSPPSINCRRPYQACPPRGSIVAPSRREKSIFRRQPRAGLLNKKNLS
jgi:hypothetical protein